MMLPSLDMIEPVIQIRDLQYRYRGQKDNALQDISLDVGKGIALCA
jgi:ABC-type transport system involved in cytochrome bd biosynthesis fused ATPase/permease subunit